MWRTAVGLIHLPYSPRSVILTVSWSIVFGKKMADTATLSSKFQISIPKSVREAHGWEAGQQFVFSPRGNGVVLVPVPEIKNLIGSMKGANTSNYRDRKDRF